MTYEELVKTAEYFRFKHKLGVREFCRRAKIHYNTYTRSFLKQNRMISNRVLSNIVGYLKSQGIEITPIEINQVDYMVRENNEAK